MNWLIALVLPLTNRPPQYTTASESSKTTPLLWPRSISFLAEVALFHRCLCLEFNSYVNEVISSWPSVTQSIFWDRSPESYIHPCFIIYHSSSVQWCSGHCALSQRLWWWFFICHVITLCLGLWWIQISRDSQTPMPLCT